MTASPADVKTQDEQVKALADKQMLESARSESKMQMRRDLTRRIWLSALSAVLTAAFLEGLARVTVVVGHPAQFGTQEFDIKHKVATTPPANGDPTIFFMGSSYISRGVYADLIEKRLNDRGQHVNVRNLASVGAFPMDELFLLKTAIKHGAKPQRVIYEVIPLALGAEFAGQYSETFRESYRGSTEIRPQGLLSGIQKSIEKHVFLVRYRAYFKEILSHWTRIALDAEKETNPDFDPKAHIQCSPDGWLPDYSKVAPLDTLAQSVVGRSQFILATLKRTDNSGTGSLKYDCVIPVRDFCRENNIPLTLIWLPTHGDFRTFCERYLKKSDGEILDSFQRVTKEWNCGFIDLHHDDDISHYADCDHLNVRGAIEVSERIADELSGAKEAAQQ